MPVPPLHRLLLLPLLLLCGLAAPDGPMAEDGVLEPFPGCRITRRTITEPRVNVVYIVRLDPAAVAFVGTPDNGPEPEETTLQTTRSFLDEHELDLAFNAHFYRAKGGLGPVPTPFADLCGAAVSGGEIISRPEGGFPAVEIDEHNRLHLLAPGDDLAGRHVVVAGSSVLVREGKNVVGDFADKPHPRTALGATAEGALVVAIVDGRQAGRSEGLTQRELADLLVEEGVTTAINLDGGGSTTLVIRNESGRSRVLNVPVGIFNQRGTERPVGSSLGVRALRRPAGE